MNTWYIRIGTMQFAVLSCRRSNLGFNICCCWSCIGVLVVLWRSKKHEKIYLAKQCWNYFRHFMQQFAISVYYLLLYSNFKDKLIFEIKLINDWMNVLGIFQSFNFLQNVWCVFKTNTPFCFCFSINLINHFLVWASTFSVLVFSQISIEVDFCLKIIICIVCKICMRVWITNN